MRNLFVRTVWACLFVCNSLIFSCEFHLHVSSVPAHGRGELEKQVGVELCGVSGHVLEQCLVNTVGWQHMGWVYFLHFVNSVKGSILIQTMIRTFTKPSIVLASTWVKLKTEAKIRKPETSQHFCRRVSPTRGIRKEHIFHITIHYMKTRFKKTTQSFTLRIV